MMSVGKAAKRSRSKLVLWQGKKGEFTSNHFLICQPWILVEALKTIMSSLLRTHLR